MRLEVIREKHLTIINDAYNASVKSMEAAPISWNRWERAENSCFRRHARDGRVSSAAHLEVAGTQGKADAWQ